MTRDRFISEVKSCQGSLRRFLTALCAGDPSLADDIAQNALVRAYVASDRFTGRFRPWLFRIAYNCFIDTVKKRRMCTVDMQTLEAQRLAAESTADAAFCHEPLQRALDLLPEKERTAIILHYYEDLPIKEIAAVMQCPAGTVKYYLSVGRGRLKKYIRL